MIPKIMSLLLLRKQMKKVCSFILFHIFAKNPHFKFLKFIQLVPDHYKSAFDSFALTRTTAALTGQKNSLARKINHFTN